LGVLIAADSTTDGTGMANATLQSGAVDGEATILIVVAGNKASTQVKITSSIGVYSREAGKESFFTAHVGVPNGVTSAFYNGALLWTNAFSDPQPPWIKRGSFVEQIQGWDHFEIIVLPH
jgi:hypothetical protein